MITMVTPTHPTHLFNVVLSFDMIFISFPPSVFCNERDRLSHLEAPFDWSRDADHRQTSQKVEPPPPLSVGNMYRRVTVFAGDFTHTANVPPPPPPHPPWGAAILVSLLTMDSTDIYNKRTA